MNIWIINEYAGSPYHGMEYRHYYFGRELVRKGHNVTVITASYSHLFKNEPEIDGWFTIQNIDGLNYVWIKSPRYGKSNSLKRVLKWFNFTISLFGLPYKNLTKPDVIILSPMQTMPAYPAFKLAKRFGAKFVFEVKDIWPLSIVELGGYSKNHPFIKTLKYFERFAIKKCDLLVSVLPGYGQYLKDQGLERDWLYLPNGVVVENLESAMPLGIEYEKNIPGNKFIVGYAGTVGNANALEYFVEAGKLLKNYKDIIFLIVGNGSEKEKLKQSAKDFDNILFLDSVDRRRINSILNRFNLCFIGWRKKNIYKYGTSPNKIFDYMLSGKPIIESISTDFSIVEIAKCGISVEAENPEKIADGVLELYNMAADSREAIGINGKNYVKEKHNIKLLAEKLINNLDQLFSVY